MIASERTTYLQQRISRTSEHWAYKELFTGFYSSLYQFALSYVKSKQIAEEVVSDVFIKIWEKRRELEKINNLKLYLYVATRNTALNYLEQQKRTATDSLDEYKGGIQNIYLDPEELLITADMVYRIRKAVETLPPKCRMIFKLVKEDSLQYKEVATLLNISVKTVENQLAIALHKLGTAVRFDIHRSISSPVGNSR